MYTKTILIAHTMLALSAVAAMVVLAVVKDISPGTAVIVILAATGIGSSSNSTLQALINSQTRVEVPKNGQPTVIKSGGVVE